MDRREAARWQIEQARRDMLIQVISAIVGIIAVLLIVGSIAHAESLTIRQAPGFEACSGGSCIHGDLPFAGPRIIHVPQPIAQADKDAADAREREWLLVCDPTFRRDKLGVFHYVYKHPGCEFGSPE